MQELSDVIDHTWLLVKDKPASKLLYASNVGGKGHTYGFRKVLIRKFKEVRLCCSGNSVTAATCRCNVKAQSLMLIAGGEEADKGFCSRERRSQHCK